MGTCTPLTTHQGVDLSGTHRGGFTENSRETVIYDGKLPFTVCHFSHGLLWLLLLGWNVGLLTSLLTSLSNEVKITSQRILWIRGLISQHAEEVEYYRIKDSTFQQTILGRLLGVGIITLFSDDQTSPVFAVPFQNPKALREQIRGFVREQRKDMRTFQVD